MRNQKLTNTEKKVNLGITLDHAVVMAISERKGLAKKSTYINNILREAMGLKEAEA